MKRKDKDEVFKMLTADLRKAATNDNVNVATGQAIGMIQALTTVGFLDNKESAEWLVKFFDIV